jgi:hypothetical protein
MLVFFLVLYFIFAMWFIFMHDQSDLYLSFYSVLCTNRNQ